eukprot:c4354_g1_i2.p1 GENE.c4354_g1_i2~~c4354_g1_i2.p1  ORF type:complete len:260 (-),score=72.67 c4354_g1_i2:89-868(-)
MASAEEYLKDKHIKEFISQLAKAVLVNQPEDPRQFLVKYISDTFPEAQRHGLKIIIAGPPASGKGTQAEHIKKQYGVVHISTGDLLRDEAARGTEIGLRAKEFMNNGQLVPDDVLIPIVQAHLHSPEVAQKGWLLDGFPRTVAQAHALEASGVIPDVFLLIEIEDSELVTRVTGRRLDKLTGEIYHVTAKPPPEDIPLDRLIQRDDDTEEKLKARLEMYHTNLAPIVEVYTNKVKRLQGNAGSNAVWEEIQGVIPVSNQ